VQKLAAQAHALLAAIEGASDGFEEPASRLAQRRASRRGCQRRSRSIRREPRSQSGWHWMHSKGSQRARGRGLWGPHQRAPMAVWSRQ
jgi:hypothetical protein